MEPMSYIGTCKVCNYGMLEVIYNFEKRTCSIMCDECLAEWTTPENALENINGYRKSYAKAEARTATFEEIKVVGWVSFIKQ